MRKLARTLAACALAGALASCVEKPPAPPPEKERAAAVAVPGLPAPGGAAEEDAGAAVAREESPAAEEVPETEPSPASEPRGAEGGDWPQWRGPLGTGVAPDAAPPVEWAEDRNVRWKAAIPGRGHSSPVVWGDRVFVTTAVETDETADPESVEAVKAATPTFHRAKAHMPGKVLRFVVMALRRSDGTVLWTRTVLEEAPHSATHADGSWASGSPVTDGERVYAYFGSQGLHCLDVDGNPIWKKRFGPLTMKASFGEGTSPVLCGDAVVVSQDHEGESFIVALDKRTGTLKWRVPRDEATSWSTPLVVEQGGRRQVVVSATKRIRGYDAASGEVLWQAGGMTGNVVPCPVEDGGVVVCASGFRGSALLAIRLASAEGDLAGSHEAIAWSSGKDTPYTPSPLLYDGMLYYLKRNDGVLTCADAATGEVHYAARRLEGVRGTYASPVGAAGRVYVTGRNGLTVVVKAGPELKVLARNSLDDGFTASAALAGGELFLRGYRSLYCIAREPE